MMKERVHTPRLLWTLWSGAAALAAFATALLYAARPGINWAMSTVAASLGLTSFLGSARRKWRLNVVVPLALACLITSGAAVTANPAAALLIAAAALFALGSAVVAAYIDSTPASGPITWVLAAPYAAVLAAAEAGRLFAEATGAFREGRGIPVIRGIAIAAPVTILLALLLCEADPTFAAAREFIESAFRDVSVLPRGVFFSVLTICLVGAFGIALHTSSSEPQPHSTPWTPPKPLGDTERQIVLGSVAALFALYLALQVSYLFGDPGGRTGSGVSYADAVHRGFVELNVAATVCGALLLVLRLFGVSGPRNPWPKALEWIVTLQAAILLVSAFHRVNLYEGAYGFTRLRLYVQVYAAVALFALILLLVELRAYPSVDRFLRRVMVVAVLALAALILGNSDGWIARANLLRYARTGRIDIVYLTRNLGPDAVPELVNAVPHLPSAVAGRIEACLRQWYRDYPSDGNDRWFEWSLRRAQLSRALTRIRSNDPTSAAPTAPEGASCRNPDTEAEGRSFR
jgi:two-component system, OmpR family, sensor histidine kinase BaeS